MEKESSVESGVESKAETLETAGAPSWILEWDGRLDEGITSVDKGASLVPVNHPVAVMVNLAYTESEGRKMEEKIKGHFLISAKTVNDSLRIIKKEIEKLKREEVQKKVLAGYSFDDLSYLLEWEEKLDSDIKPFDGKSRLVKATHPIAIMLNQAYIQADGKGMEEKTEGYFLINSKTIAGAKWLIQDRIKELKEQKKVFLEWEEKLDLIQDRIRKEKASKMP